MTQGNLWRRLQLVGQPYWFGSMRWTWPVGIGVLAISAAIVYMLTVTVSGGAEMIVGSLRLIPAKVIIESVTGYGAYGGAAIVALIGAAWYFGRGGATGPGRYEPEDVKRSRRIAWTLLIVVLAFMVGVNILNVIINKVSGAFTTALNKKEELEYWKYLYIYAGVFIVGLPIVVYNTYFRRILSNHWRKWLTHYLLVKYFGQDRAYYRINGRADIDNPDERIHQDVSTFVDGALSLLLTILGSLITLVSFVGILWSISQFLTWSVIAYAAFGTVLTIVIGRVLVGLNGLQLRYEADFRFGITHVRNHAESIAFYRGEEREQQNVGNAFQYVYWNYLRLLSAQRNLQFFTTGFDYVVVIIPALFLAPMFFKGEVEIGVITQATMAFRLILHSLAVIVDEFRTMTLFAANTHRIGQFVEALDEPARKPGQNYIDMQQGDRIALQNVTLVTPDTNLTLVKDVNLTLDSGKPLLIVGPSGSGKSSLLRVIAGLWLSGSGRVFRPVQPNEMADSKHIMFLPQKPYMVSKGTLRDQLTYPNMESQISNEELHAVLETVNLPNLESRFSEGFETVKLWSEVLSLGEQQRLAIARLLITNPKIVILDEATSALDVKNERRIYEILRQRGAEIISIGHRPTLTKYHSEVLELKGDGNWELMTAEEFARREA